RQQDAVVQRFERQPGPGPLPHGRPALGAATKPLPDETEIEHERTPLREMNDVSLGQGSPEGRGSGGLRGTGTGSLTLTSRAGRLVLRRVACRARPKSEGRAFAQEGEPARALTGWRRTRRRRQSPQ